MGRDAPWRVSTSMICLTALAVAIPWNHDAVTGNHTGAQALHTGTHVGHWCQLKVKARLSKGVGCRVSGVGCRVSGVRMELSVGGEKTSHLPPF
ncbi:MAG: hypothetical protein RIG66_04375, partial [Coleofasciculus sp. E2-BRE-01]